MQFETVKNRLCRAVAGIEGKLHISVPDIGIGLHRKNLGDGVRGHISRRGNSRTDDIRTANARTRMAAELKTSQTAASEKDRPDHLSVDSGNFHLGVGLSVTELALLILLGLVGEDNNLLRLAVLENLCGDARAFNRGSSDYNAVILADGNDLVKGDLLLRLCVQLFDEYDIAGLNLLLLSAGFDNCVHQ